jgi:hypothetical protein
MAQASKVSELSGAKLFVIYSGAKNISAGFQVNQNILN